MTRREDRICVSVYGTLGPGVLNVGLDAALQYYFQKLSFPARQDLVQPR